MGCRGVLRCYRKCVVVSAVELDNLALHLFVPWTSRFDTLTVVRRFVQVPLMLRMRRASLLNRAGLNVRENLGKFG